MDSVLTSCELTHHLHQEFEAKYRRLLMIAIPLSSERGVPGGEERGEMDVFAGYLSLGQHAKLILPVMGYVARFLAAVYGE